MVLNDPVCHMALNTLIHQINVFKAKLFFHYETTTYPLTLVTIGVRIPGGVRADMEKVDFRQQANFQG